MAYAFPGLHPDGYEDEGSGCPSALREAWVREADERMRAFRDGEISAVDGPQAMAELRSRFSK